MKCKATIVFSLSGQDSNFIAAMTLYKVYLFYKIRLENVKRFSINFCRQCFTGLVLQQHKERNRLIIINIIIIIGICFVCLFFSHVKMVKIQKIHRG